MMKCPVFDQPIHIEIRERQLLVFFLPSLPNETYHATTNATQVMETASNRNTKTYNPEYSSPRTAQKRTVTAISAWLDILSAATRCDFGDGVGKKGEGGK